MGSKSGKKEIKKTIEDCWPSSAGPDREEKIKKYKTLVEELRKRVTQERAIKTNYQFKKMTEERKKLNRNEMNQCLTVKNVDGIRLYNPDAIKHEMALCYVKLFSKKNTR